MKRILLLLVLAFGAGLSALIAVLTFERPEPVWTTESPRAREAFEQALDAMMRSYQDDAQEQLDRALELDPSFAIARVFRDRFDRELTLEQRIASVEAIELERLNAREQVMIRSLLAAMQGDRAGAEALFDAYLAEFPADAFIRSILCASIWEQLDWSRAKQCYQELIERHPNWVEAQNHLGYIAMAEGRFQDAADRFEAYRFVAPDQANPYDSMAELAILRGDLEAASSLLDQALAIRDDFCPAHLRRVHLALLERDFAGARAWLDGVREGSSCQEAEIVEAACIAEIRIAYLEGDYEEAWTASERCPYVRSWNIASHRSALLTGRDEEAREIEAGLTGFLEEAGSAAPPATQQAAEALLLSYEGSRLMLAGRFAEAAQRFRDSDHGNRYWGRYHTWLFKLFNRVDLVVALERSGAADDAAREAAALAAINPLVLDYFRPGAGDLADAFAR